VLNLAEDPAASAAGGLRLVLREAAELAQMGLSVRQAPAIVTRGDPVAESAGEKPAVISEPRKETPT
jgi:hypothetical protein